MMNLFLFQIACIISNAVAKIQLFLNVTTSYLLFLKKVKVNRLLQIKHAAWKVDPKTHRHHFLTLNLLEYNGL
jgi:hypothetical protein